MELSLYNIAELLFTRTCTGYAALVAAVFLLLLFIAKDPVLRRYSAVVVWLCAFSMYDVFGYDFLVMTDSTATDTLKELPALGSAYAASLNAYRILQVTFQTVLTAMVCFSAGGRAAAASLLLWWGGTCDMMYYGLTMRALPREWDWMWFTPAGMMIDVLPLWLVLAQAGLLALLAGLLLGSRFDLRPPIERIGGAVRFTALRRRSRWPR
jgi:hypothetical protein